MHRFQTSFILVFCCVLGASAQSNRDCRVMPSFTQKANFDQQRAYFTTSERKVMGLVYAELPPPGSDQKARTWQHPSWTKAGWLGPMVITEKGEIWVAPVPVVNLLHNKPEEQNRIWKTDKKTGELKTAIDLPRPDSSFNKQNPYGLLGLGYDCDNAVLYASSVFGSTLNEEKGRVFAINTADMSIVDQMDSVDIFGVGIGFINGEKRLYFGAARNGNILSVGLKPDGSFNGTPRVELSLEGLGPRGDDRARKIRFAPDGTLTVHGVEFYFNLTAPTERQETPYQFKYIPEQRRWVFLGIGQ